MVIEIRPKVILNFPLSVTFTFLPPCDFHCLAFLELSTGSIHCTPDEKDRPSGQTNPFLLSSIYAVSYFSVW